MRYSLEVFIRSNKLFAACLAVIKQPSRLAAIGRSHTYEALNRMLTGLIALVSPRRLEAHRLTVRLSRPLMQTE
jgi:hypothetical protein